MKPIKLSEVTKITSGDIAVRLEDYFSATIIGIEVSSKSERDVMEKISSQNICGYETNVDKNEKFAQLVLKSPVAEDVRFVIHVIFYNELIYEFRLECVGYKSDYPIIIKSVDSSDKSEYFYQSIENEDYIAISLTNARADYISNLSVKFQDIENESEYTSKNETKNSSVLKLFRMLLKI